MGVGLAGALLGGMLTLLSPCSVMLLPAFFAFAFTSAGKLLGRVCVFYLGLATTLVPLGVLSGTLGAFVGQHRPALVAGAAVLIMVLGAVQLLGVTLPAIPVDAQRAGTSTLSVYLLGTVYGLAGVCAGPLLGTVLALAALGGNPLYGALVLLVFAVGMVVPLLVLALLWSRLEFVRRWLKPRQLTIGPWTNTWTNVIGGLLTIGIGVLLLATEGTATLGGLVGATDQFRLESQVLEGSRAIPDWAFVLAAIAVLAVVWAVRAVFRRRQSR
jgi:cytochrome c biogenesis protein CcdA